MRIAVLSLILASVTMSAVAQIALKYGMSSPIVQANLNAGLERIAPIIAANPFVWAGLTLYGVGALLWLGVLAQIDVSQAYPYVGLGTAGMDSGAHAVVRNDEVARYYVEVFRTLREHDAAAHGFAMTKPTFLLRPDLPWSTVDSSSWTLAFWGSGIRIASDTAR